MITVTLTSNLQKYFPRNHFKIEAESLRDLLKKMDQERPLFSNYILEDGARIRLHVNVFVDGEWLSNRSQLDDPLRHGCEIHIMQALSGG